MSEPDSHAGSSLGNVGFIGLGVMGRPMAENLLTAGARLVVHNRSRPAQDALVARGAAGAQSPEEVAGRADIIITMLADDDAVRSVVGGGLLAAARPGSLIVDMSTVSPALSRELAARAAERDVRMLDAPVSGGDVGAREGTLSIMVGGDAADLERARPVLEVLGASIVHAGPAGAGQVVKACNQVLVAITIAGVSEALVLGTRLGVAPETILDVLSRGLAANRVMDLRRANFLNHAFSPGFKVDLHHKDLDIALAGGGQANVPLPLTAITQQLFRQLRAAGRGGEDHTALLAAVEALAGLDPGKEKELG
jgi:2-hydroxy-3-oxopropionate reductase